MSDLCAAVDFVWLKFNRLDCAKTSLVFFNACLHFENGSAWIGRYAHEENPAEWKERGTGEVQIILKTPHIYNINIKHTFNKYIQSNV